MRKQKQRGVNLIEVLVVLLIMTVLIAIAIPFYFKSVDDSENYSCKTNMSSVAAAVQATKVRTSGSYWTGTIDETSTGTNAPMRDLHNAVPKCPGDSSLYSVLGDGSGGFMVRCGNAKHKFQWHNGKWENY